MASTIQQQITLELPQRPDNVRQKARVVEDPQKAYVAVYGYSSDAANVLGATTDDVETLIDYEAYDRMENESSVWRSKKILITKVLSDEMQMSPGATESSVGAKEFKVYGGIMEFCQRMIAGLEAPYRSTCEQILGNAIRYGHGIAEIEWEYRNDGPSTKPTITKSARPSKFSSFWQTIGFKSAENEDQQAQQLERPVLKGQKTRLMPKCLMVKPRNTTRFVVDAYRHLLGLVATRSNYGSIYSQEIISLNHFLVLTLNKQDEDPRGRSSYRTSFTWNNIKTQLPTEVFRFVLEETVPKSVGTLGENQSPYEFVRDRNDNIVYEDDGITAKMVTATESMGQASKNFRSGSGIIIPYGAKFEPYKKAGGSGDVQIITGIIDLLNKEIERGILLQTLAQSEGNQARENGYETHSGLLEILIFMIRWELAMMTLGMFETGVRKNFGDWAVRYLPFVSFGDFVRRDWNKDLEVVSKAYFYGFIDDTQRAEIMAWLNLPTPGPSRQEVLAVQDATTGEPTMPNRNRPDKQPATKNRNDGNGTEKKNNGANINEIIGIGSLNTLGHHGTRFISSARNLFRNS